MNEQETITAVPMDLSVTESQDKALIDKQIATAKQYPRNIHKVRDNVIAIASMDEETARSCGYALPRDGKTIFGASVHLARIVAQQYGNIRVDSKIVDIGRTHVTAQATCIDLENNVGMRVEVKRLIVSNKTAKRYSDDMITVTGNAAAAIALRNAIWNVVPKGLVDAGYRAAQQLIIGDVSDETKLLQRRKKAIDELVKSYGVTEGDILRVLGLRETTQIKANEIMVLAGLWTAIKDGDTTVDEVFFPDKKENGEKTAAGEKAKAAIVDVVNKMKSKKEQQQAAGESTPENGGQQQMDIDTK